MLTQSLHTKRQKKDGPPSCRRDLCTEEVESQLGGPASDHGGACRSLRIHGFSMGSPLAIGILHGISCQVAAFFAPLEPEHTRGELPVEAGSGQRISWRLSQKTRS